MERCTGCSSQIDLVLGGGGVQGGDHRRRLMPLIWKSSARKRSLRAPSAVFASKSECAELWCGTVEGEKAEEEAPGERQEPAVCPRLNLHVHSCLPSSLLVSLCPVSESVGSVQPLVVLHAYPTSFAERQRGRTPALRLLPRLRWHEPLLRQHTPRSQQQQPREAGALQGSPLCAG